MDFLLYKRKKRKERKNNTLQKQVTQMGKIYVILLALKKSFIDLTNLRSMIKVVYILILHKKICLQAYMIIFYMVYFEDMTITFCMIISNIFFFSEVAYNTREGISSIIDRQSTF